MSNTNALIRTKTDLIYGSPATLEEIKEAEKVLSIKFADEYIEYLKEYGFICCNGHELTGICNGKRLDVINVTLKERRNSNNVETQAYVIEQTHIDGIVIWQETNGHIYQSQGDEFVEICGSLFEYVKKYI